MKNTFLLFFLLLIACTVEKPGSTADKSTINPLLFRIADDSVMADEFIYVYEKNNARNENAFTKSDVSEYLRLYENFKLKVHEARERGMDTATSYLNEMKAYEEQLKKPYLTETQVTDQLVQEAYDRFSEEIRARHILIQVAADASPQDTLVAYNTIQKLRQQAIAGKPFDSLAAAYSQDPSAAQNGGDLQYFTSLQMVYPFESAAYETPVDSISGIIRSQFGYHIIQVTDRRPANNKVAVSHIMIRHDPRNDQAARNKIFEVYDQAVGGVDWSQLVNEYSEDQNSKRVGGRIQSFGLRRMPFEFQEAAFALEPGDISDPVRTDFGWHIIQMDQRFGMPGRDELEETIRERVENDVRADMGRQALLDRLSREWNATQFVSMDEALSLEDTISLFRIGDSTFTTSGYEEYVNKRGLQEGEIRTELVEDYYNASLLAFEESHLEEKYIDYRMLLREYREGILLFQLMDEEIWSRAANDSTGLANYYEANRSSYRKGSQVRGTFFTFEKPDLLDSMSALAASNAEGALEDKLKQYQQQQIVKTTYMDVSRDSLFLKEGQVIQRGDYLPMDQGLLHVDEVDESYIPEILEIRGRVIADYQNYLENKWIQQLRSRYNVIQNEDGVEYIYEELVR